MNRLSRLRLSFIDLFVEQSPSCSELVAICPWSPPCYHEGLVSSKKVSSVHPFTSRPLSTLEIHNLRIVFLAKYKRTSISLPLCLLLALSTLAAKTPDNDKGTNPGHIPAVTLFNQSTVFVSTHFQNVCIYVPISRLHLEVWNRYDEVF